MDEKLLGLYEEYRKLLEGMGHIPVFGEGPHGASIMLIGEAPGAKETELGRNFVGAAGKNLDSFLKLISLPRESIFITNIVKFRPYKVNPKTGRKSNRPPTAKEVSICAELLIKEIEIIDPKVIVTLGNTALRAASGEKAITIGDCHGKLCTYGGRSIYPLYHPASIIYNRSLAGVYEQDVLGLRGIINA